MKRIVLAVLAASLAAPVLAANGAAIYAARCKACHGPDGKGSPVGIKMGAKDLAADKDAKKVEDVVTKGKGKMSAFGGKLSPEEIQAVSKYVAGGVK